jgi:hypothetical protein
MPLVIIKSRVDSKSLIIYGLLWLAGHVGALMPCKWFEFDGLNSFALINLGNYCFFAVNILGILGTIFLQKVQVQ